jgi:hypothetical protein
MTKATSTMVGCAALWLTTACGGGAAPAPTRRRRQEAPAEPKKEPEDAGVAKRKAEREAKAAAKVAEEKKKAEKVAEITKLPEGKLPKKLDKACDTLTASYDAFMHKHFPAVGEDKLSTQRGMMKKNCMGGKIEVAACQANAYDLATAEISDQVNSIQLACLEKFGGAAK